jgi:hypothetical protein
MMTFLIAFAAFCIGNYLGRMSKCGDCCYDCHCAQCDYEQEIK